MSVFEEYGAFKSHSTIFKLYGDEEGVIMKGSTWITSHKLNSASSGIWTWDLINQSQEHQPLGHAGACHPILIFA